MRGLRWGAVNNVPEPLYDPGTIFEVLETTGHSWKIYNDTCLMSLARLQFPQLWDSSLQPHIPGIEQFEQDCRGGVLPEYSFVEPSFQIEPNGEHPPHAESRSLRSHLDPCNAIRDWLEIPEEKMLKGVRVEPAPTLGNVLTRSTPRAELLDIAQTGAPAKPTTRLFAVNSLQWAMLEIRTVRKTYRLGFQGWFGPTRR
ncbi:MAG: alkaline phosphatase family protein [Candidatus Acidiferrum sp.]|jgi:hypothetical protein